MFFFFKQKTAYEMRISDWSSDVCSSDLDALVAVAAGHLVARLQLALYRDEHLDHLEHARRQLVAPLQLLDTIFQLAADQGLGVVILRLHRLEVGLDLVVLDRELPPFVLLDAVEHLFGYVAAFLDALGSRRRRLTEQHLPEARIGDRKSTRLNSSH